MKIRQGSAGFKDPLYGGTALGLEDAHHREVLPLFRRGGAAESFEGFDAQLDRLEAEPGVRQQL